MKARFFLGTLIAVALVATPTVGFAQSPPGGGTGNGGGNGPGDGPGMHQRGGGHFGGFGPDQGLAFFDRMLPRLAERIGLSDEQLEQIESIVDETRPAIEDYLEELRAGRDEYRSQNDDPTVFDDGAFRVHANAQHAIQIELKVLIEETKARVFRVLTAEQIDQIDQMRADMGSRFKRHGGGRRTQ